MRKLGQRLAAAALMVLAAWAAVPVASAADPLDPYVPGVRAAPRAVPTPRITPRPPPAAVPRVTPGPLVGPSPGVIRPTNPGGANCRSRCGSQCQMISCSGLNAAQCNSARQRCRSSCSSRC